MWHEARLWLRLMCHWFPNDDGYDFKRSPFGLQYMAFWLLKGDLLACKRSPPADPPEANENRKQKTS